MANTIKRRRFILIPDGSRLVMRVTSQDEGFTTSGEAARNGKKFKSWTDKQLVNKVVELAVESPDRYTVLIDFAFTARKKARVGLMAILVKPDGTHHGSPWAETFGGKKGDTSTAILTLNTRKND